MAEDKSDEWFAKHNKQKAAAWDEEACLENHHFLTRSFDDELLYIKPVEEFFFLRQISYC